MEIVHQSGQGAPLILLFESEESELATAVIEQLDYACHLIAVRTPQINGENWEKLTTDLQELLRTHAIRQASFVVFGDAGAIVQNLALKSLKTIRRMVLVDGVTRPHSTWRGKLIDWIEEHLPLGLPLRKVGGMFDSRPFLQRMRCPVLLISVGDGSSSKATESAYLARHLPTAWFVNSQGASEIAKEIVRFQEVAAKRPQKNVSVNG